MSNLAPFRKIVEEEDWKNFKFRMLLPSDLPILSEHMITNYYPDEPISAIVGTSASKIKDYDNIMRGIIEENLSFAAFDKETGKMAGARLISLVTRNEHTKYSDLVLESPEIQITINFLRQTDAECDICAIFGVDQYANLRIQTVDKNFRRVGLATEMYQRALRFLKANGLSVAKSVFTSPHTRNAALKCGFRELARRHFREMVDLNDRPMCPQAGDQELAAVMAIQF